MANMSWHAARIHYKDFPIPLYSELIQPGGQMRDSRTEEEIKRDMLERMHGGSHGSRSLTNRETKIALECMFDMFSPKEKSDDQSQKGSEAK